MKKLIIGLVLVSSILQGADNLQATMFREELVNYVKTLSRHKLFYTTMKNSTTNENLLKRATTEIKDLNEEITLMNDMLSEDFTNTQFTNTKLTDWYEGLAKMNKGRKVELMKAMTLAEELNKK